MEWKRKKFEALCKQIEEVTSMQLAAYDEGRQHAKEQFVSRFLYRSEDYHAAQLGLTYGYYQSWKALHRDEYAEWRKELAAFYRAHAGDKQPPRLFISERYEDMRRAHTSEEQWWRCERVSI